jgi:hypothetical protein
MEGVTINGKSVKTDNETQPTQHATQVASEEENELQPLNLSRAGSKAKR